MYLNGMEVIKVPLYRRIQSRRHKSKRINKKWLKRYGKRFIQTRPESDNCFIAFNKIMVPEEIWEKFIELVKTKLD